MPKKVYVLMPDKTSGLAFDLVLRSNGIDTHAVLVKIAPRVTPEGELSTDLQVGRDLEREIQRAKDAGFEKLVIACNTLQFFLTPEMREGIKIYTTFDAVPKGLLWLGTKPTARRVGDFGYKSLYDFDRADLQELVQEIIWRVKGTSGDDTSSAPEELKADIGDRKALEGQVIKLIEGLRGLGVDKFVMGCTELPVVLAGKVGSEAIDPAIEVAKKLKSGI